MPERQSISQMRATGKVRQATVTRTICLDSELADAYRAKREELVAAVDDMEKAKKKPGRAGGPHPDVRKARKRVDELSEELDVIADDMAGFEVDVVLRRKRSGDWNRWAEAHPPRAQDPDEQGRRALLIRDVQHGSGRCDFDALVEDLLEWVETLNGASPSVEDWAFVADNASPADLDDLADDVLALHGEKVSPPKPLKSLLSTLLDGNGLPSRETGE